MMSQYSPWWDYLSDNHSILKLLLWIFDDLEKLFRNKTNFLLGMSFMDNLYLNNNLILLSKLINWRPVSANRSEDQNTKFLVRSYSCLDPTFYAANPANSLMTWSMITFVPTQVSLAVGTNQWGFIWKAKEAETFYCLNENKITTHFLTLEEVQWCKHIW